MAYPNSLKSSAEQWPAQTALKSSAKQWPAQTAIQYKSRSGGDNLATYNSGGNNIATYSIGGNIPVNSNGGNTEVAFTNTEVASTNTEAEPAQDVSLLGSALKSSAEQWPTQTALKSSAEQWPVTK